MNMMPLPHYLFHGVLHYNLTSFIFKRINQFVLNVINFLLKYVVIDGEDVTSFPQVEKVAETFFGLCGHCYVYDKKFSNPSVVAPQMITKISKINGANHSFFNDVPQNELNKHNEQSALSTSLALAATHSTSTPPQPHNDISPASVMPQPITCSPGFPVEMKRRLHFDRRNAIKARLAFFSTLLVSQFINHLSSA